ncbi:MAG: YggS family pyridoxal phosphate-dependent enzyme [Bacteroidota bacterium]
MSSISDNLSSIQQRIQLAAEKADRDPADITLIAVSKTKPMSLIHDAFEAGQLDFGENKVQEVREKQPELPDAQWHVIGTLQRNKVKYIAGWVHLIHSVDTARLLAEISKQAVKNERIIDCLLQMNISGEENKHGLEEADVSDILTSLDQYPNVRIKGLMGMAEFTDDETILRSQFGSLRTAKEKFASISHDRIELNELSMGMSGDFEIAIEEGSTMIRVGSAIFGSRNYG